MRVFRCASDPHSVASSKVSLPIDDEVLADKLWGSVEFQIYLTPQVVSMRGTKYSIGWGGQDPGPVECGSYGIVEADALASGG